jgi:hypothetical protein
MNEHYRDQVTDLCEWLRDKETARFLCELVRDPICEEPEAARLLGAILAGKADQIDPAIQLEPERRKDKPCA